MIKKILCMFIIGIVIFDVGCAKERTETKNDVQKIEENTDTQNAEDNITEENTESEYLNEGDTFTVDSEIGSYEFTVLEANYLGIHEGDTNERVQIVWEINNISFNGYEEDASGNKIDEGFCRVPFSVLKVKDDNDYILDYMSTGWDGDFSNTDTNVYIGEKAIQKATWSLNSKDTEYVYVSFSRMDDKEFKIKINK